MTKKRKKEKKIKEKKTEEKKSKNNDKKKKTDIQKEKKTDILKDHRGIIFASLYTIIKNKMGNIFLSGQNQCHITGVKKSYFCHTFHLRPKKVFWWVLVVGVG